MLRLARQRLGFTQKAAAARVGVAQPVLSRFENGPAEPDDAFLHKAASAYNVPREFFDLRDPVYGPPVSVHPMLRAKADISARDLDMVVSEMNLRVMYVRRFLDAVDYAPTIELPSLEVEQYGSADRVAGVVRAHWGVPSGPLKNLTALVERSGVIVGTSDFSGASISGMTFRVPGQPPLVLLNRNHPADRMRFTLAHELGHLVMHRLPTAEMEDEANAFASALLMPEREMREALSGRRITLEVLAALKPEWRVAMQALLMRAKALGYLSDNQNRYLWQQISARGWRMREPSELDFPHEQPTVLKAIIKAHLSDLGFSMSELSRLVPLYESEFVRMYDLATDAPEKPRFRLVV
jgi:Zn-dependent peptidase ImmA (M78 family)/DNA-binding XRE family transcriptional regulator